ncbi:CheR family methyltransferase [Cohnella thailandensis]|uniref:Protein-glutamate O-methyltransferase CheR n=1 Tax=Cohnella thailandensis TaxID=557557 RepID=A0A841T7P8_9BACL|nr:protein-glutamate O-methyltransferase CheR [Cohnella thailandensis]MBB6637877.1 protein-glutamate O-methyltransferase CheR [Cohnella thailandensis]MBP1977415.1 chemotaxis protein methyltransferase CheR [Cohnella thailandensis]
MMEEWRLPGYDEQLEKLEIKLLLEAVYLEYGYDFRQYAYPSLRRRIRRRALLEKQEDISSLQGRVLHDRDAFERLLSDLVIPVTELFRNPATFRWLRERLTDGLRDVSFLRVWHAGCATGEEAYSSAIWLEEEGMLGQARIYATDISRAALNRAREGQLPKDRFPLYDSNYREAGGQSELSRHCEEEEGFFTFKASLKERIVFAEHNLATDRSFNEFHLIFCRNVMIYFDPSLRERVHRLFYESLAPGGILVLGGKESLAFTSHADHYETLSEEHRVYRKIE